MPHCDFASPRPTQRSLVGIRLAARQAQLGKRGNAQPRRLALCHRHARAKRVAFQPAMNHEQISRRAGRTRIHPQLLAGLPVISWPHVKDVVAPDCNLPKRALHLALHNLNRVSKLAWRPKHARAHPPSKHTSAPAAQQQKPRRSCNSVELGNTRARSAPRVLTWKFM